MSAAKGVDYRVFGLIKKPARRCLSRVMKVFMKRQREEFNRVRDAADVILVLNPRAPDRTEHARRGAELLAEWYNRNFGG